jgi:hypothetical protein
MIFIKFSLAPLGWVAPPDRWRKMIDISYVQSTLHPKLSNDPCLKMNSVKDNY